MKNEIRFTLESKQRPKLAQEIGNILGTAPHYERVPSCAKAPEKSLYVPIAAHRRNVPPGRHREDPPEDLQGHWIGERQISRLET